MLAVILRHHSPTLPAITPQAKAIANAPRTADFIVAMLFEAEVLVSIIILLFGVDGQNENRKHQVDNHAHFFALIHS